MNSTAQEYQARVAGTSLHCRSVGDGPALLWAHALLSSIDHEDQARIFDWSDLAGHGNRWVRYDARGHGKSDEDHDAGHHEWSNLARDMLAVADGSGLETFAAGGASMGCATALWCAHQAPERIDKLVLALPPTAGDTRRSQAAFYRSVAVAERLRLTLPLHLASPLLPRGTVASTRAGYLRSSLASMAAMRPAQVAAALRGAAASDLPAPECLADIGLPTLILGWRRDRAHPSSVARMLDDTLPDATLDIADDDEAVSRWPGLVAEFLTDTA